MTTLEFLIALAGAVLGAASILLHVIAPRTKTTLDDRLVAKLDELLGLLRPPAPTIVPGSSADLADQLRRGVATFSGPAKLLALVVLGLTIASSSACTPAQRTATGHAVVDCTAGNGAAIGTTLASMKAPKAGGGCLDPATSDKPAATDWTCVRGKAITDGVLIGGCAFLQLVSGEASSPARVASATGEPPPERPGRAAFESYRASVAGGATFRTRDGDR